MTQKKCPNHPNTRADICVPCKGSQICEHDRRKYRCTLCGTGKSLCVHKRIAIDCKECGGSQICEHKRRKAECKDCGGIMICKHGRNKSKCKEGECHGSQICEHDVERYHCKKCNGNGICVHGEYKYFCIKCEGKGICVHGDHKSYCVKCQGSQICKHERQKRYCKECDGSALCKSEWCESISLKHFEGYCRFCFVNLHPDHELSRNFKTKEKSVVDFVKESYPELTWISDKTVKEGCSKRRPDLLCDFGEYILIIEVDENQHKRYDSICENKRMMEISLDLGHRPIIFIRFNPDGYIDKAENKIKTCWTIGKDGILRLNKNLVKKWNERLEVLKTQIDYYIKHKSEKTLEIVELFYDQIFYEE